MAAVYRLKGIGWLASGTVVALSFYLVSSQVAAERKKLDAIDGRILAAQRDIRALETEFDVRANLVQLERWNGDTLSLTVPTAAQFVRSEAALAALSPERTTPGEGTRAVALIVPSRPAFDVVRPPVAPVAVPVPAPAAMASADDATKKAPRVASAADRHVVAARKASDTARPLPAIAPAVAAAALGGDRPRNLRAVAMLDRALLGDTRVGDILNESSRSDRSRLR